MSAPTIKVPKGWRRLRKGSQIITGDRWTCDGRKWYLTNYTGGEESTVQLGTYIRRNPKPSRLYRNPNPRADIQHEQN